MHQVMKSRIILLLFTFAGGTLSTSAFANEALLLEITYQLEELHKNVASLQGNIEEVQHELKQVKSSQDAQYIEFDERIEKVQTSLTENEQLALQTQSTVQALEQAATQALHAASSTPSLQTSTVTVTTTPSVIKSVTPAEMKQAQQSYQQAKQLALNGSYDEARTNFTTLAEQFPNTKYAGYAYYWLGQVELAYDDPDLDKAQKAFSRVVSDYPDNKRLPETLLRLSEVELALQKPKTANALLDRLRKDFPNSRFSKEAKALQESMEVTPEPIVTPETKTVEELPLLESNDSVLVENETTAKPGLN